MLDFFKTLDGNILLWIQESFRHPMLTPVMRLITALGDAGLIWIAATLLLLVFKKTRKVGCMSALALVGSLVVNNMILKPLVARPRPYTLLLDLQILIDFPKDFSFPSGHTASSFAAGIVFFRNLPKRYGIPALVLAVLIAVSRLYLGVHYPSDVLGGIISGTLLAVTAEFTVKQMAKQILKKRDGKRKGKREGKRGRSH